MWECKALKLINPTGDDHAVAFDNVAVTFVDAAVVEGSTRKDNFQYMMACMELAMTTIKVEQFALNPISLAYFHTCH